MKTNSSNQLRTLSKLRILRAMTKLPGGLLLYPMLVSAMITTFLPDLFKIGSPSEDLFTSKGIMVITGLVLFVGGTQFTFGKLQSVIKRAGLLIGAKLVIVVVASYGYVFFFGNEGILGLHVISFITIICSTNPGLYLAAISHVPDAIDYGVFAILNFVAVPVIPLLLIGSSSGKGLDLTLLISTVIPLVLGMLLRFLDNDFGKFFVESPKTLLLFLGFAFGTRLNLVDAMNQWKMGLVGTILFYIIVVFPLVCIERKFLKSDGKLALSMSTVAGISLAVPILLELEHSDVMIGQISLAIILTSAILPFLLKRLRENELVKD